jgi:uncharacterized protein (TIGR02453 family)
MRIQRDLRFSKDKSPYKTHIGAGLGLGGRKPHEGVTALYVHFGVDEEYYGVGQYVFDGPALAKWRKLVAGKKGEGIAKIVAALEKAGMTRAAHETMARVPRDVDPEHPRAELLKMKGLVIGFAPAPRGLIHKPAFVDWVVEKARRAAPLATWLYDNL